MSIEKNYQEIQNAIQVCTDNKVKIIGVSKFQSEEKMREAWNAGLKIFGENRVQEGKRKKEWFPEAQWHLIGHLQKNKARQAVQIFDWIHSVDSLELAEVLNHEAGKIGKKPHILIQVNIAKETQKFGISEEEACSLIQKVGKLPNLKLSGMMVIAPLVSNPEETRGIFQQGKTLFDKLQQEAGSDFCYLSMGMSNDYLVAIEEGANMIRVGRILFGES